jgi:hypothetical protein
MGSFGVPLFAESISAWDMGPVVGELWYREEHDQPAPPRRELTEAQLNTIGYVLSRYGMLTGRDLEVLTHSQTPWQLADRTRRPGGSVRIDPEWIRDFFAHDHEEDEVPLDSAAVGSLLAGAGKRREDHLRPDSREEIQARLAGIGG